MSCGVRSGQQERASMDGWRECRWRRPAVRRLGSTSLSPATCWRPTPTPRPSPSRSPRCPAPTSTCRLWMGCAPWPWRPWWPTTSDCTGPTAGTWASTSSSSSPAFSSPDCWWVSPTGTGPSVSAPSGSAGPGAFSPPSCSCCWCSPSTPGWEGPTSPRRCSAVTAWPRSTTTPIGTSSSPTSPTSISSSSRPPSATPGRWPSRSSSTWCGPFSS
jgi:hypothetical protein